MLKDYRTPPAPVKAKEPPPVNNKPAWGSSKAPSSSGWAVAPRDARISREDEEKKKEEEKRQKELQRQRAKEEQKREEEYVKSKGTTMSLQEIRNRREREAYVQSTLDPGM